MPIIDSKVYGSQLLSQVCSMLSIGLEPLMEELSDQMKDDVLVFCSIFWKLSRPENFCLLSQDEVDHEFMPS